MDGAGGMIPSLTRLVAGGAGGLFAADAGSPLDTLVQILLIVLVALGLLLVGAVTFALVALLAAFLREALVGVVAALCRLLTWPLIGLARGGLRAREKLLRPAKRTFAGLRYTGRDQTEDEDPNTWAGWDVLGPLLYFAYFLLLGAGDFYLMSQRFVALFGLKQGFQLDLPLDLLTGVLWVILVATFGTALLDLHGATPVGRPFHNAGERLRRFLIRAAWACFVLSLLAAVVFWLWGQYIIQEDQHISILGLAFTALFAFLLNAAVFFSGWAALPSIAALYGVLLVTLRLLLWLLYGALDLLVRLLNGLTRVVMALIDIPARAGRTIYNWLTSFDWARDKNLLELRPFEAPELPVIEVDDLLAPDLAGGNASSSVRGPKVVMARPRPTTSLAGLGDFGEKFLLGMVAGEAPPLGPDAVLAVGALNDALTLGAAQSARIRIRNVSPHAKQLQKALKGNTSQDLARQELLGEMVNGFIRAQESARVPRAAVLFLAGLPGVDAVTEKALAEVGKGRPARSALVFATLPHPSQRDARLGEGFDRVRGLWARKLLGGAILLDPSSPFAVANGEQAQARFATTALAGLLAAAPYQANNKPLVEIMASVAGPSGYAGMAFAGRALVDLTPGIRGRRAGSFPTYDLAEMTRKALEATHAALHDTAARAVDAPISTDQPFALIYTAPLAAADPRWPRFMGAVHDYLSRESLTAAVIFAPGLGMVTDGASGEDYGVQVTALYPLPAVPKPVLPYLVAHASPAADEGADSSATNPVMPPVFRSNGRQKPPVGGSAPRAMDPGADPH